MSAALLAVLLLIATVDPRLAEPLHLVAEVRTAVYDVTVESTGPSLLHVGQYAADELEPIE